MIGANHCFGLDFAAVAQIHAEIMPIRNGSPRLLLVGEDLDELLKLADRIVVIFNGRLVYEAPAREDLVTVGCHLASHGGAQA
jgi:simple sugar transport system ATP-binding protein